MNSLELLQELKQWLEAEKLAFNAADEDCLRVQMNGDHGLFSLRLQCEAEPLMLHAICPVGVRVVPEQISVAGLVLHQINAGLRMGAFHFHVEERVIAYRLAMPIRPAAELAEQFGQVLGTTLSTLDEHIRTLSLLACNTTEVQQALTKLIPASAGNTSDRRLTSGRLELN